jgi:hypothetical protein
MRRASFLWTVFLVLAAGRAWGDGPYMKLDDLHAGMKGVVRTVLTGVKVEDIPLEVVDVMRRVGPDKDVVIVRLLGDRIKELGVARGMSGSPVYVDGKLVGALSSAWRFVREPIAGVTPIDSMMKVRTNEPAKEKVASAVTWRPGETIPSQRFIERMLNPTPAFTFIGPANMTTLQTPISVSGLSKTSASLLSEHLRAFDVAVVEGGAGAPRADVPADFKLEPGGTLCIPLVRGDFEASALGTVTEIAGNRVYGFGHPLFGNGVVEYPLATGYIHIVVPTEEMSFKLGSVLRPVGSITVDQASAVAGELGKIPEMMKVVFDVKRRDLVGDSRFNFDVVKDPRMMLTFLNAAIGGVLDVSGKPDTDVKIVQRVTMDVEGYPPLEMEEVFGGPQAPVDAFATFVIPFGTILHNPYARVNIRSLHVSTEVIPGDPRAVIRSAETDKTDYRPGEDIDVRVTFQPFRGKIFIRHYKIKIPLDVPGGALMLLVCDAVTDERMESREMPHRFRPEDVQGIMEFFRRSRPTTDVVFRLSRQLPGLAVKGREMPGLPGSVISVLGKEPSMEVSPFLTSVIRREPTGFVVVGEQELEINVIKD